MRRMAPILCGALLILAVPSAGALAATGDHVSASTPRIAAEQAAAACDVKLALKDGPLVDGTLTVHSDQPYSVHGLGFPPTTTLTIEFSQGGVVKNTFHANSDADGGFVKGFTSWLIGMGTLEQKITVYDPADKDGCIDSVNMLLVPSDWTSPFTDIKGHQFEVDIVWLYESGITKGCSATKFCPDDPVARGEMAAFLVRALDLPATATDFFTDDETSIFEGVINRLAASGITKGCTLTKFCPLAKVTRGEMAAFLHRGLVLESGSAGESIENHEQ